MSNSDSFINEVTEEVRREKLYGYLRRYGWIGVACVLLLVGGAAWNEYSKAQTEAAAQATGDALFAALEGETVADRAAALEALAAEGPTTAVTSLLQAATQEEAGEYAAATATLEALATDQTVPQMYRDIAAFKAASLPSDDPAAQQAALDALSQPGQPFRLLALEQLAYLALQDGRTEDAIALLKQIEEDAAVTGSLRERVQTLMVALGVPVPEPVDAVQPETVSE